MAFFSCFSSSLVCVSLRIDPRSLPSTAISCRSCTSKIPIFAPKSKTTEPFCEQVARKGTNQCIARDFLGGLTMFSRPNSGRNYVICRKSSGVYASWIPSCQIAGTAFTWGTAAVLPFYTFMIVAPKTEFTKKVVGSSIPYVLLATLYGYLLYLSWTPDTIRLMFASKYWLPELQGMANLFSSEMTLASAWIHLLAVDLFAARQVYNDGLQNNIETRHSVSLCLMSCPIGILAHLITKAITRSRGKSD